MATTSLTTARVLACPSRTTSWLAPKAAPRVVCVSVGPSSTPSSSSSTPSSSSSSSAFPASAKSGSCCGSPSTGSVSASAAAASAAVTAAPPAASTAAPASPQLTPSLTSAASDAAAYAIANPPRTDWTRDEIQAIYSSPLLDLIFHGVRFSQVHRAVHGNREVQQCTLLSVKTGGCSEDCSYCAQSSRYDTSLEPAKFMPEDEVISAAKKVSGVVMGEGERQHAVLLHGHSVAWRGATGFASVPAKESGSTRFCMGTAWRGATGHTDDFNKVLGYVRTIKEWVGLGVWAGSGWGLVCGQGVGGAWCVGRDWVGLGVWAGSGWGLVVGREWVGLGVWAGSGWGLVVGREWVGLGVWAGSGWGLVVRSAASEDMGMEVCSTLGMLTEQQVVQQLTLPPPPLYFFPPSVSCHPRDMGMEVCCMLGMLTEQLVVQLKQAGLTAYNHNLDTSCEDMGMEVCCTLGMLTEQQAVQLKQAGLTAYNHNLDTSREFYPNVISTRTYDDRLQTIAYARNAGISVCSGEFTRACASGAWRLLLLLLPLRMVWGFLPQLCPPAFTSCLPPFPPHLCAFTPHPPVSPHLPHHLHRRDHRDGGGSGGQGGIIGMGEAAEDRVGLLYELATMPQHPESVPVNLLVPIPGTPLESQPRVPVWDVLRMIATARIIMPQAMVRMSAGRLGLSVAEQALCFLAGANSIFTGERLLTTANNDKDEDAEMFQLLGLLPKPANLSL
ncbi:unnamed protein product [Closterium sp. NIES-64]|nr:unnamed protein product [Closterium sp. NIES-64]